MTMGSDPRKIHRVEAFLQKVNDVIRLKDEKFHAMLVAVTEAVNNAVIHGNKRDPTKKVSVTCEIADDLLTIRVKDEGKGFLPGSVPNPLREENLLRETGRGLFLMHALMESVTHNSKGNEVTMTMRRA